MRHKLGITVSVISLLAIILIPCCLAAGQAAAAPSLLEQLQAQYKAVKLGTDANGPTVLEEGTVLAIQKGGILGVPYATPKSCSSKYQNGKLSSGGGGCTQGKKSKALGMLKKNFNVPDSNAAPLETRYFKVGEKVYPSNIAVDLNTDKISFAIVACDACNQTDPPTHYKSQVDFHFAKGFLATADVSKIEDTIGEVFSIDNAAQGTQAQQAPAQPEQPAAQQQAPAQAPAPAQIPLGQSVDDVVAALGQSEKIVDLGAKKIYVYKDLKITFTNGKVSDVQ